jgi:putative acetyltransferase
LSGYTAEILTAGTPVNFFDSPGKDVAMAMVRAERPGDARAIHAVHVASFPTSAEAELVDQLRTAGRLVISLVAEADEAIVGHAGFSPVTLELGSTGMGLAPVAVIEGYRCRGIAAELVRCGLEECRAVDVGWVVVLGDPAYYARFGFRPASDFGLRDEFNGGRHFQVVELIADQLPRGAGLVRYAPEFSALA